MYGINAPSKEFDGLNKYIRITDISDNSNKYIPNPLTSPDSILENKFKLKKGDIVFARTGASTGKSYLYDEADGNLYFAGFLIRFHIDKANPQFIFYNTLTEKYLNWVSIMSVRSGQPGINAKEYKKLKINLPSIEEQNKIVGFISKIDLKIDLMEKKYKTLQKYKSALIQQIFTKNIRFSNFSNNWNYYYLGELGETYSGLTGLSKENFEHGTSKFIPYKVIFDNEVIDIDSLEPVQLNNKKQEPVKKGDLFFTGSSETPEEVGMVSVLNENIENCYLNSFCFGYRLNDFMKVNPLFLSYLLRSPLIRREIKVLGQGSTRFNISKKEIMKLTVEIPSLEEQKKIITLLENLTNNIHFMKNKNSKIKEFKKYLLQQMFV